MRHLPLVFLLVVLGCGSAERKDVVPAREAARLLVDRNWLDVWPREAEERLHVFRFTPAMGGGVYQDRTLFAGQFELFRFHVEDDQLVFDLPHTRQRAKTGFRITKVHGPHPFDLKLELSDSPRGPNVYYGLSSERAEDADVARMIEARR